MLSRTSTSSTTTKPRLYDYQEQAVKDLLSGKHIVIAGTGMGKTAIGMTWAKAECEKSGKKRVLVITTASKSRTNDFQDDADKWCGKYWRPSLVSFEVISWYKFAKWVKANLTDLDKYVLVADEVAKMKAGTSSGMGKAFLKFASTNKSWAGFTATPGDKYIDLHAYYVACGLVKNKTQFLRDYCIVQTYKGFPEIVGYRRESELKAMWVKITTAPDTSKVMSELPQEGHKVIEFKKPPKYAQTAKTRMSPEGEMLDTSGALCAELRRQCFTKEKQEWIKDFVENLGTGAVIFYNFVKTGDELAKIIEKALPDGAKVWRIDGKHHEIPTAETFGKQDIVLCQWQSGSEALNLQFLHYWVSVELCYSYSTAVQARGRIRRIGQKHFMRFYYLQTTETIEQAVLKCLKEKGEFSEDVWLAELESKKKQANACKTK